jgi:4-hydroxy 2-oxovalerate aldolase
MRKHATILDCTLRDGSYAVQQQFTAADTARICAALESCGISHIEVGHGVGLGASGERFGVAAASDRDYIAAAAGALSKARFGAFYVPGVGSTDLLDMARDLGMHFVRIGTNVSEYGASRSHIEHARKIGLDVSYNAMKSYLATPPELLAAMRETVSWGAQAVYVVDSAGHMLPQQVKTYIEPLAQQLGVPVGFHGHNNLMMANANCLAAWEAGATSFDGTLQGLGRSGGNAQSEILALIFERMNVATGINTRKMLEIGEQMIRPLMGSADGGATSLNIVIGMAGFHSSHLDRVKAAAERHDVELKDLILSVSERDQIDPSQALIDTVAADLRKQRGWPK